MSATIRIETTARILAEVVLNGTAVDPMAGINAGTYPGTSIRIRQVPADAILVVTGTTSGGTITDGQGEWIADRLGRRLGARHIARLIARVSA